MEIWRVIGVHSGLRPREGPFDARKDALNISETIMTDPPLLRCPTRHERRHLRSPVHFRVLVAHQTVLHVTQEQ